MNTTDYLDPTEQKVSTPILSSIYNGFGFICLLGIAAAIVGCATDNFPLTSAITYSSGALFLALVFYGLGQVVMLVAKIEFNTRDNNSAETLKVLKEIANNGQKRTDI